MCLGLAPFIGPVQGQDGASGVLLDFSLSQRVEAISSDTEDDQTVASTGLNFSAESRTRTQTLRFGAGTDLRFGEGNTSSGIDDARLSRDARLSYQLRGKESELRLSASYALADIEFLRPAELIVNDEGELDVPTDVNDLTGVGLRERNGLNFNLSLFQDAPIGLGLSASRTALNYRDVETDALDDSVRSQVNLSARFDLSSTLTLNTRVGQSWTMTDNEEDRESLNYGASLSTETRIARVGLAFSASDEDEGNRSTTRVFWEQELHDNREFNVSLGMTQAIDGDNVVVASAGYTHTLRNGNLRALFDRQVREQNDGDETVVSALSVRHAMQLDPVTSFSLGASMVDTAELGASELERRDTSFSVGVSRALTEDWNLNMNLGLDQRFESDGDTTSSERISFSISRSFSARY